MTPAEYKTWYAFHAARFPNWASFMVNLDKFPAPNKPTTSEASQAIYETLADVGLTDAIEASRRLARGDESEIDQMDQHAKAVRGVARRLSGERLRLASASTRCIGKEPTFRCLRCEDVGVVTVWHPETVRECRDADLAELIIARKRQTYTCVVACDCAKGHKHAEDAKLRSFNGKMLQLPNGLHRDARLKELVAWANRAGRHLWSPDGDPFGDEPAPEQSQIEYDPTT